MRHGDEFVANPPRHVSHLDGEIKPPNRAARVLTGYTLLGRPIDIVETSRGCTYDCSFCSIIEMRGRNFHTWSIERHPRRHPRRPPHAARARSSSSTTTSR